VFRVKGDLAQFPFDNGRDGELRITARVSDAALDVNPSAVQSERSNDTAK